MSDSGMMAVDHLTRGGSGASEQPRSVMAGGAVKGWLPGMTAIFHGKKNASYRLA